MFKKSTSIAKPLMQKSRASGSPVQMIKKAGAKPIKSLPTRLQKATPARKPKRYFA